MLRALNREPTHAIRHANPAIPIQEESVDPATSANSERIAVSPLGGTDTPAPYAPEARMQGNAQTWKNLAQQLTSAAQSLSEDATPQAVLAHFKSAHTAIDPRSAGMPDSLSVSLEDFVNHHGLPIPQTRSDVIHLMDAARARALESPTGALGGALDWPLPLPAEQQNKIRVIVEASILRSHQQADPGSARVALAKGMLGVLIKASSLSDTQLQEPAKALDILLSSPKAQALGLHLQSVLGGIATHTSISDYLLAAIHTSLDRENVRHPVRNTLAGFDLAQEKHWGMPPSEVVSGLSRHLVGRGRATPATATLATHILLTRAAPQFLVKDIPASMAVGSQAWASFCLAVAKVEAHAPGTAGKMGYGQVMSAAQALNDAPENATKAILLDWGVANGIVVKKDDALYGPQEVESIRTAFNQQINAKITASQCLDAQIPSKKAIALEKLKEHFGDNVPFELKCLSTVTQDEALQLDGKHSMLDMAMMGINVNWKSDDDRIPIDAINRQPRLNVNGVFLNQYEQAIESLKKGIDTHVKHLICELPLEDRKNLEFGKIDFYQSKQYKIGRGLINPPTFQSHLNELLVRTEREVDGKPEVCVYEIDIRNKRIVKRQSEAAITRGGWRDANIATKIEPFTPKNHDAEGMEKKPADSSLVPSSFTSPRTQFLADAFSEHLDIDSQAQWKQASGTTTLDEQKERKEQVRQFFLNLIPLRSAIVNFRDGDYEAGFMDLALDAFGLLTAAASTGAKVAKVASTGASAAVKGLKTAKIISGGLISALNPLSGAKGLATGTVELATKGARLVGNSGQWLLNKVRGASGSYDLLKGASKEYGPTLVGSFKVAENSTEGVAVLKNDKWYNYDPFRNTPYGPPLEDFTPLRGGLFDSIVDANLESVHTNIAKARTSNKLVEFNQGYRKGTLGELPDYAGEDGFEELVALAAKPGRTPKEMGVLSRVIKEKRIEHGNYFTALLANDVGGPGVSIDRFSQSSYLARVDLTSKGDCAGMVNAMALALHRGDETVFLENMRRASTTPLPTAQHSKFNQDLNTLQASVNQKETFHIGTAPSVMSHPRIIDDLSRATTSKYLRISTRDHALLAGVRINAGKKEWFFFEPNGGLVKFDNPQSMQAGLEKVLNSGSVGQTLNPRITQQGQREFHVSPFHPNDIVTAKIDSFAVSILVSEPLPA
jgi:hypothetical protein